MRLCILLFLLSFLVGCAEQPARVFEMPLSQWNQMSETQRQNTIEQYNVTKLSNYPTQAVVTMTPRIASHHQPLPELSILDEHQKSIKTTSPSTSATQTALPSPSTRPNPMKNTWLQLNE